MTYRPLDMVKVTAGSAPGTGNFTGLSAVDGFQTPAAAGVQSGDTFPYGIVDGNNREEGIATYTSAAGGTIARSVITYSTNSGAAISASANAVLYSTARAADIADGFNAGGFKNKFRNPGMDVAQRGTSGTVSAGYALDGWIITAATSPAPWSQVFNANISGNALRLSGPGTSSAQSLTVEQRIESSIAAQLLDAGKAPQATTVRFAIYNNTGATITPALSTFYPTAQDNWGAFDNDLSSVNLQSIPNGTLAIVAYTFTPNVSIADGYRVLLNFGSALSNLASTAYIDISRADIRATPTLPAGLNNNPAPSELRPLPIELAFCQRYYVTSYGNGVAPGTATTAGAVAYGLAQGYPFWVPLPVQMRAPGALSYWDLAGNASKISGFTTAGVQTNNESPAESTTSIGAASFWTRIYSSVQGGTAFHYALSAEL